jgi:hypothetical protein
MNTKRMLGCLIGLVLLAAGCSQKDSTSPAGATPTAAAPTTAVSPAAADPLKGQWLQQYTCQDVVRTLQRTGFATMAPEIIRDAEGASQPPSSTHPCAGAPSKFKRIARFQDGRLVLFDGPLLEADLNASYQVVDDHTFTANDAGQNIDGTYTFKYRIDGNRLTVDVLQNEPHFIATWEATPFYRTS